MERSEPTRFFLNLRKRNGGRISEIQIRTRPFLKIPNYERYLFKRKFSRWKYREKESESQLSYIRDY